MSNVSERNATFLSSITNVLRGWVSISLISQHFKKSIIIASFDSFKLDYKDYLGTKIFNTTVFLSWAE
jgi:hypothetical protein